MASWSVVPDKVLDETIKVDCAIIVFRSGLEVRSLLQPAPKRTWTCFFNLDKETVIRDHFLAQNGPLESFDFVHPETSVVYRVRYSEDSLARKKVVSNLYQLEVKIVEVFGES